MLNEYYWHLIFSNAVVSSEMTELLRFMHVRVSPLPSIATFIGLLRNWIAKLPMGYLFKIVKLVNQNVKTRRLGTL